MDASLTERFRVSDEGFRVVKLFWQGRKQFSGNGKFLTVPAKKVPANYVPAAAVIRKGQTLFEITGRKACVGCFLSGW